MPSRTAIDPRGVICTSSMSIAAFNPTSNGSDDRLSPPKLSIVTGLYGMSPVFRVAEDLHQRRALMVAEREDLDHLVDPTVDVRHQGLDRLEVVAVLVR